MRMSADYLEYSIKTLQEVQRELDLASAFELDECLMLVEHVVCFIHETNSLLLQENIDIDEFLPQPDWLSLELQRLTDSGQGISFAHFKKRALAFVEAMTGYMEMWLQKSTSTF